MIYRINPRYLNIKILLMILATAPLYGVGIDPHSTDGVRSASPGISSSGDAPNHRSRSDEMSAEQEILMKLAILYRRSECQDTDIKASFDSLKVMVTKLNYQVAELKDQAHAQSKIAESKAEVAELKAQIQSSEFKTEIVLLKYKVQLAETAQAQTQAEIAGLKSEITGLKAELEIAKSRPCVQQLSQIEIRERHPALREADSAKNKMLAKMLSFMYRAYMLSYDIRILRRDQILQQNPETEHRLGTKLLPASEVRASLALKKGKLDDANAHVNFESYHIHQYTSHFAALGITI